MSGKIEISRDQLEYWCVMLRNGLPETVESMIQTVLAAPVVERQVEGRRERFQKWVLATEHPVLGFLDGHWIERGDDREGYANEYVQGLWVAYKAFASPPAPVAVASGNFSDTQIKALNQFIFEEMGHPSDWCFSDEELKKCLDKVKELNQ